jgi:hypothetical protein
MHVDPYLGLVYLHILLFVYWLGGDLGVFVSARYVADRKLSLDERFRFLHVLLICDMGPRTALILILPVGFEMARILGLVPVAPMITGLIWLFCLSWLAMNWWMFKNERHPVVPRLRAIDMAIRYVVMTVMGLLGLISLIAAGPVAARWLAAKMVLFACVMALGLYLRGEVKQWMIGFGMVRQGGEAADRGNTIIEQSNHRARRAALVLWFGVALIAFIGLTKPF